MEDSDSLRKITLKDTGIDMSNAEFNWKIASLLKGTDPKVAYDEIERIKQKHKGELTAEILLNESRPVNSVLHHCFNWNDSDAAHRYRLGQARDILKNITVNIISNGEPKNVRVYEVVKRVEGKGLYKNIESFTSEDVEYIRMQAIKSLTQYRNKLAAYDEFRLSLKHLDNAISELEILAPQKIAV